MTNNAKSIIVIALVVLIIAAVILLIINMIKKKKFSVLKTAICLFLCVLVIPLVPFMDPREKTVELNEFATIELGYHSDIRVLSWFVIYKGSLLTTDSPFNQSSINVKLPELDLDNHSYVISFGRKLEKLSYNVWDHVHDHNGQPLNLFFLAKSGHPTFSNDIDDTKVYIYEIERLRIDNDII